ncbi:lactonase family protein [Variovorax ureilyticus]|uniref:lactonase family protein n=1 Tax=Variovorax ureilyticus TaxID=1836198 RepID=UPI003D66CB27
MFCVYVSNAESGDISVLHLDPSSPRSFRSRPSRSGEVMPLALSPDRRRLYAARRSEPREALSFAIDPKSGRLAPLGAAALPHSMAYIATDRTGRYLFSASYGGNQIAVNAIDAHGIVQSTQQVLPTGPNAHAIQVDPSNRFIFASTLGAGVVVQLRFDAASGQLTPNTPPTVQPHTWASPRHFVFGRDARFVYLLNELDGAIDILAFDAAAGTLQPLQTVSSLPPGFRGDPWASDLHLTPDGRFLYSSERRSDTLAAFRIDPASGMLTLIGHVPTEAQPRGFNITPDGRFLIAAGQRSHRLRLYEIDAATGALQALAECPAGQGPNWVESIMLES